MAVVVAAVGIDAVAVCEVRGAVRPEVGVEFTGMIAPFPAYFLRLVLWFIRCFRLFLPIIVFLCVTYYEVSSLSDGAISQREISKKTTAEHKTGA